MKKNIEGGGVGVAVEEASEVLEQTKYETLLEEFNNFKNGPESDPESKAGIEKSIADLEAEIADKCPAEYKAMQEGATAESGKESKPKKTKK